MHWKCIISSIVITNQLSLLFDMKYKRMVISLRIKLREIKRNPIVHL